MLLDGPFVSVQVLKTIRSFFWSRVSLETGVQRIENAPGSYRVTSATISFPTRS